MLRIVLGSIGIFLCLLSVVLQRNYIETMQAGDLSYPDNVQLFLVCVMFTLGHWFIGFLYLKINYWAIQGSTKFFIALFFYTLSIYYCDTLYDQYQYMKNYKSSIGPVIFFGVCSLYCIRYAFGWLVVCFSKPKTIQEIYNVE